MKILIAKQNQDIIKQYASGITFYEVSKNLCFFKLPQSKFQNLYDWVKSKGHNPFALMTW